MLPSAAGTHSQIREHVAPGCSGKTNDHGKSKMDYVYTRKTDSKPITKKVIDIS